MVNEDRKMSFIEHQAEQGLQTYRYQRFFNKISASEDKLKKDICEMTSEELAETMEVFNTPNVRGSSPMCAAMRNYARWSKDQGFVVSDVCFSFRMTADAAILQSLVGSPQELASRLTEIYGVVRGVTSDIAHALLWLAFIGVPAKEACMIENDDFDFRNHVILHNGRYYAFPPEATEAFISVTTRDAFLVGCAGGKAYMKKRVTGSFSLRAFRDTTANISDYYDTLIRKQSSDKSRVITYENAKTSGLYYKIYQSNSYVTSRQLRLTIKEICLNQAKDEMQTAGKIVTEDSIKKTRTAMSNSFKSWLRVFHPDDYNAVFGRKSK